ncbi:hypothetical protein [Adlercreutzia sp. ZJ473]|uniref:hypothetical protein n=1 Tax=Adlercreutzia sp. ZJ473 TaxID=2722822 RepID=UPI001555A5B1|nr:hypothetical protein [Adlercreutzia sp. ZJ473]
MTGPTTTSDRSKTRPEPQETPGTQAARADERACRAASSALLAEYGSLREEALQKVQLHNTILMFAVTSNIAVFALAFTTKVPEMFLLPLVVVVPATWKAVYYKMGMIKLGTYVSVFIEPGDPDLGWETRAGGLSIYGVGARWAPLCAGFGKYLDLPMVGVSSIVLYVWGLGGSWSAASVAFLVAAALLLVMLLLGILAMHEVGRSRESWRRSWQDVREGEARP